MGQCPRMDYVKFLEDSLQKIWIHVVCWNSPYLFKFLTSALHKFYLVHSWTFCLRFHPPSPTTTHHHPPSPTTITHHPPPPKIYLPTPTTTQKMDPHPAKAKIYSYIQINSFWHSFNSSFFFEMQYTFSWKRFCVIKFWSVRFWNSKFLLHFTIFKIL